MVRLTSFIELMQWLKFIAMLSCGQPGPFVVPRFSNTIPSHYWPWHAAIFHKTNESISPTYRCSGTLISSNWILTAGQCVSTNNLLMEPAMVSVSLGEEELSEKNSSIQSFQVAEIILHPDFNSSDFSNDIALIRLAVDAAINDYVRPICLWQSSEKEFSNIVGSDGTVIGWDRTDTGVRSNEIQQVSLSVVPSIECLRSNRNFFGSYLTETNFCAGRRNGLSVQLRDTGGSMSFDRNGAQYIRGIVSVVPSQQISTAPKVDCNSYVLFTDVALYLRWIIDTTLIYCTAKVQCNPDWYYYGTCRITFPIKNSAPHCEVIVDHDPNADISQLKILGESENFPDLWDAFVKFGGLKNIDFWNIKLKSVNFSRIPYYIRNIEVLNFDYNQIAELHVDTFDQFERLKELSLGHNRLTELPVDVFKQPYNLEWISLEGNQLEILPAEVFRYNRNLRHVFLGKNLLKELSADQFKQLQSLETLDFSNNQLEILPPGLFRNNHELKDIRLQKNKIKKIESDFDNLPLLMKLDFGGNVCIDVYCDGPTFCGASSPDEMNNKIKTNCTAN